MRLAITTLALALLSLPGVGCAPFGEDPPVNGLAFMPEDPESWAAFQVSSARFLDVSGVEPVAAEGGTTIRFMPRPDGLESCGDTVTSWNSQSGEVHSIEIRVFSPPPKDCYEDPSDTLTHEMIHAIRAANYVDQDPHTFPHSVAGLFYDYARDPTFEQSSLDMLCEAVDCPAERPE